MLLKVVQIRLALKFKNSTVNYSYMTNLSLVDVAVEPLDFVRGSQLLFALFSDFLQLLPLVIQVVNLNLDLFGRLQLADGDQLLRDDVQLLQASLISLQILRG